VVRRLQNQQVRYSSFRQSLPRRDPCILTNQAYLKNILKKMAYS
jgi:hypothetical protein